MAIDTLRRAALAAGLILLVVLAGCSAAREQASPPPETAAAACPLSVPELALPPDDPAVMGDPLDGLYFINADRSLWAAAPRLDGPEPGPWRAGPDGNKVGWFRPEGAPLAVSARRLDGAGSFTLEAPCCYPTRFQASGLVFSAPGCWEVTANAAESELVFVAEVLAEGR